MVDLSRIGLFADLQELVERVYGVLIRGATVLDGGFESAVYRLDCGDCPRVIRIGPKWRSSEALHTSYLGAAHVANSMPEVPAPYPTETGVLVPRFDGRPISMWPYIEGRNVDPANEHEVQLAAATLARLHRELASAPLRGYVGQAQPHYLRIKRSVDPKILKDDDLDHWLSDRSMTQPAGPVHGDYWYNNLIFSDERIAGVIDWDDARISSVERELSSAVWEFCADPIRGTLSVAQVTQFLDLYAKHDGPVPLADRTFIVPFIRDHLRSEIRQALAFDRDILGGSLEVSLRAFADLRQWSL